MYDGQSLESCTSHERQTQNRLDVQSSGVENVNQNSIRAWKTRRNVVSMWTRGYVMSPVKAAPVYSVDADPHACPHITSILQCSRQTSRVDFTVRFTTIV